MCQSNNGNILKRRGSSQAGMSLISMLVAMAVSMTICASVAALLERTSSVDSGLAAAADAFQLNYVIAKRMRSEYRSGIEVATKGDGLLITRDKLLPNSQGKATERIEYSTDCRIPQQKGKQTFNRPLAEAINRIKTACPAVDCKNNKMPVIKRHARGEALPGQHAGWDNLSFFPEVRNQNKYRILASAVCAENASDNGVDYTVIKVVAAYEGIGGRVMIQERPMALSAAQNITENNVRILP